MFADDFLLFGQATTGQLTCVQKVLETFGIMSGQQVSKEKTFMIF